jgi:hypothetical protein
LKWCGTTAQPQWIKSVLPDDNFKLVVMKILPKYANIALLFIKIYMPVAEVVLLDSAA